MCLVNREIYPPFIALVNVHQHQFSFYVYAFIVLSGSLPHIGKGEILPALCHKMGLVSSELYLSYLSVSVFKGKFRFVELPCIHFYGILIYLGKTKLPHRFRQHVAGFQLRLGA